MWVQLLSGKGKGIKRIKINRTHDSITGEITMCGARHTVQPQPQLEGLLLQVIPCRQISAELPRRQGSSAQGQVSACRASCSLGTCDEVAVSYATR